jgi:hypothetical protein
VPPSKPGRLPGDPAAADRDFGPLGGLADDVFFWQKSRERSRDLDAARLVALSRLARGVRRLLVRIRDRFGGR